jgi:hypothetical protein
MIILKNNKDYAINKIMNKIVLFDFSRIHVRTYLSFYGKTVRRTYFEFSYELSAILGSWHREIYIRWVESRVLRHRFSLKRWIWI